MKILSIGNSFSSDATRYVHEIAKSDGVNIQTINLYIGGCSLATHCENMHNNAKSYMVERNGIPTARFSSIKEALQSDQWDYVTMQQASPLSVNYETYQPYLGALSEYVSKYAPKAEQIIHQTWAYAQGSEALCEEMGYQTHHAMLHDVKTAYDTAAKICNAKLIPSGTAFADMVNAKAPDMYRDPTHASMGLGRYVLGLVWYGFFTGNRVIGNRFRAFDEPVCEEAVAIAQRCVQDVLFNLKGRTELQ